MLANLLRGERLQLTSLSPGDVSTIVQWEEDALFLRLSGAEPARPRTAQAIENWLNDLEKSTTEMMFAIRLHSTDEFIGLIGLDGIIWTSQVGNVFVAFGSRTNWGQGYGFEALQLLLTYAFTELNLYRLELTVFSYNTRAIALYEKCGFKKEGTFREFVKRDGQRYDMFLFGLLYPEWKQINDPP